MEPSAKKLNGYDDATIYEDRRVVRISIRRTGDDAYPPGWRYTFHYGALSPGPETLDDGTIRRYDNAHEKTKGHERHVAPDPNPETIEFPGIEKLYERFWDEIPKPRFGPETDSDNNHD